MGRFLAAGSGYKEGASTHAIKYAGNHAYLRCHSGRQTDRIRPSAPEFGYCTDRSAALKEVLRSLE